MGGRQIVGLLEPKRNRGSPLEETMKDLMARCGPCASRHHARNHAGIDQAAPTRQLA